MAARTTKTNGKKKMTRTPFLVLYIIVALLIGGGLASPWTATVLALTLGQKGFFALLSPVFLISIVAPFALVVFAHLRGKRIGFPKLVLLPLGALALAILPLLLGLLSKLFLESGNPRSVGTLSIYISMFVATGATMGPIILHTICCVIGGKRDPVPLETAIAQRV